MARMGLQLTVLLSMVTSSGLAAACQLEQPLPRDCREVYSRGCTADGLYTIDPHCPGQKPFHVYCTNQYTVFQRRMNGAVDFNKTWEGYKTGFGTPDWELWLGLEKLHCLTSARPVVSMHVDLTDCRWLEVRTLQLLSHREREHKLQTLHRRVLGQCWGHADTTQQMGVQHHRSWSHRMCKTLRCIWMVAS